MLKCQTFSWAPKLTYAQKASDFLRFYENVISLQLVSSTVFVSFLRLPVFWALVRISWINTISEEFFGRRHDSHSTHRTPWIASIVQCQIVRWLALILIRDFCRILKFGSPGPKWKLGSAHNHRESHPIYFTLNQKNDVNPLFLFVETGTIQVVVVCPSLT